MNEQPHVTLANLEEARRFHMDSAEACLWEARKWSDRAASPDSPSPWHSQKHRDIAMKKGEMRQKHLRLAVSIQVAIDQLNKGN